MSGRRRGGNELVTISWRDIPAQVTAGNGPDKHKVLLGARFQYAIDRAAVVAGLTETQAYVAEWRREVQVLDGDPAMAAATEAERIERAYSDDHLEALVRSGGAAMPTPTVGATTPERSEP